MKSFLSKETIIELVNSSALSDDQLSREFDRIVTLTNRVDTANLTETADKADFIVTQARFLIDNTDTHACKDFANEISDLKTSINNLSKRLCVSSDSRDYQERFARNCVQCTHITVGCCVCIAQTVFDIQCMQPHLVAYNAQ